MLEEKITLTGRVVGETDMGLRFRDEDLLEVWLPKSQIVIEYEHEADWITLSMPLWLAVEKGLY